MQIKTLALLLFCHPFLSCQNGPQMVLEANLAQPSNNIQNNQNAKAVANSWIIKSADGGKNWQDISTGLPETLDFRNIVASGNELYVLSSEGLYHRNTAVENATWEKEYFMDELIYNIYPGKNGLYASSDQGHVFQKINGSDVWLQIFKTMEFTIANSILELDGGTILIGGHMGLFKSTDGGKTWQHPVSDTHIANLVSSNGVLVCTGKDGVMRSTDGGEHWSMIITQELANLQTAVIDGRFTFFGQPAGPYRTMKANSEFVWQISDPEARNWASMEGAGLPDNSVVSDLLQVGKTIYCGMQTGIYRSDDDGKTWSLMYPYSGVLQFDLTSSNNVIYAIKANKGGC